MILDKKFAGTLDQGLGQLLVFAPGGADAAYGSALKAVASLGQVVDTLHGQAEKLK
jgi:26S proteasome regulatory subunit N6